MKPETIFRTTVVDPFLKNVAREFPLYDMTIQQLAIIGDPDKIICVRGRFVALELKDDGQEPTVLQAHKLKKIQKAGGIALWTCPSQWEKTKNGLYKLAKGF